MSTRWTWLPTPRSHSGLSGPTTWLGRWAGHQLLPQSWKSACHGRAIRLVADPGTIPFGSAAWRNRNSNGERYTRGSRKIQPDSIPGKNDPPHAASRAARLSPAGVTGVFGGGAAGGWPGQSLRKVPADHWPRTKYWNRVTVSRRVSGDTPPIPSLWSLGMFRLPGV